MVEATSRIRDFLRLDRQRNFLRSRPRLRMSILITIVVVIPLWQSTFWASADSLERTYRVEKGYGGNNHLDRAYFYHTLGLYPVSSNRLQTENSPQAARALIKKHRNEFGISGVTERTSILLLLPHFYLGGDIKKPSFIPANAIGFVFMLIALYGAFWWVRLEILGIAVIALMGSNPFLLHEVYRNNVFGWIAIIGLGITALHIPFFARPRYFSLANGRSWRAAYLWGMPVATGLLIGTAFGIRPGILAMLGAIFLGYIFIGGISLVQRCGLVAVVVVSFFIAGAGWTLYFDRLTVQSAQYLKAAGYSNVSSTWRMNTIHPLWHIVWMGLGDFDGKYGHLWDDIAPFSFAYSRLDEIADAPSGLLGQRPEYSRLLRDNIIETIINDPLWYGTIIAKRLWVTLFNNTPPRMAIGSRSITLPVLGLLIIPFTFVALFAHILLREWLVPWIVLFMFFTGSVAIVVTSGAGYKHLMVIHVFMYSLMFGWVLEAAFNASSKWRHSEPATDNGNAPNHRLITL